MPGFVRNTAPGQMTIAPVDAAIVGPAVVTAPNTAPGVVWLANQMKVFRSFFPDLPMGGMAPATVGAPGTGVSSGTSMGPGRAIVGDATKLTGPFPQTSTTSTTIHNLTNAPGGLTPAPGQTVCVNL